MSIEDIRIIIVQITGSIMLILVVGYILYTISHYILRDKE